MNKKKRKEHTKYSKEYNRMQVDTYSSNSHHDHFTQDLYTVERKKAKWMIDAMDESEREEEEEERGEVCVPFHLDGMGERKREKRRRNKERKDREEGEWEKEPLTGMQWGGMSSSSLSLPLNLMDQAM